MIIDFEFKKDNNIWRIKEVENLEEFGFIAHLRFLIYSKRNIINLDKLKSLDLYNDFLSILKMNNKDYFGDEYELDEYDRWYQFLHYYSGKKFSRLFMALKTDESSDLNLGNTKYKVVCTERYVEDDVGVFNPIGLPVEPDCNLSSERLEGRISEVGRLIKLDNEDGSSIQALHRCIFQCSLDSKIPDLYCSAPLALRKYYESIGFEVVQGPFIYKKLGGGEWLLLHMNFNDLKNNINNLNLPKIDEIKYFLNPLY